MKTVEKKERNRETGIDIVGHAPWGTHLCLFYKDKQDLIDVLVPYFKAGLQNNEFCMWVTSQPLNAQEATGALRQAVQNLDAYIDRGQIEILDYTQWYTESGEFEADKVLQGWVTKHDEALKRGFDGLRLSGNTFWLEKDVWREFVNYEATVNNVIGKYRMLAVCTYSLERCGASEVIDVVSTHQFALIRREDEWQIIESTKHKNAEEALQASESKYRTLLESLPQKIFLKDRNSVYVSCNDNYARDLKIEAEQIAGRTDYEFYPKELAEKYRADDQRIMQSGQVENIEEKYISHGQEAFVQTVKTPVKNQHGNITGVLGIFWDITERKKMEEAQKQLVAIIEATSDFVGFADAKDKHIIYVNKAGRKMCGIGNDEDVTKLKICDVHPEWTNKMLSEEILPVAARDGTWTGECAFLDIRDRHEIPVLMVLSSHKASNGEVEVFSTISRDITEHKKAEEAQEASQRFLKVTIDSIPDVFYVFDTDRKFILWNKAFEKVTGYSHEEVSKMRPTDFFDKKSAVNIAEAVKVTFEKGFKTVEESFLTKDGRKIPMFFSGSTAKDFSGRPILCGIGKDVTEHKQAEERLLAVNALQKLLLPSLPIEQKLKFITDAVVRILDADFARIWVIKPGDRCDAGCTHAEVTEGPHVCQFRDKCLHLMASSGRYTHIDGKVHRRVPFGCYKIGLIAAGEQDKFLTNEAATDPRVHNHDWVKELGLVSFAGYRLTHTDGTPLGVLALFSKHPISPEEDALLERIAYSTSRVIHTSRTEEALRKSEERYKSLFKANIDGILIADPTTKKFRYANPAICRMLGYSEEELTQMGVADIHPKDSLEQVSAEFEALASGAKINAEVPCVRKDGQVISVSINVSTVTIDQTEYLMGIFRDITDRKKAEQAFEKLNKDLELAVIDLGRSNKELQDFAYVVSHDLKAPLRGIKTLAQWISTDYADRLDQNGKEQMNLLLSRVDRMHNLIDGILQYSRVGRVKENKVQINLNELVSEVIDMVAPPENISITVENELPVIEFERTRITQVFQNLLSNAVKFMDKPEGQVKIGCVEEDGFWKFTVADNGPGIEEKYFEKIFDMFQTLAPRDEVESTGVGLTVAKKIVELYGGKIWVQSKVGEGSTFLFTLPKQETEVKDAQLQASIIS
jgi:PAS domain S-box-containing protein